MDKDTLITALLNAGLVGCAVLAGRDELWYNPETSEFVGKSYPSGVAVNLGYNNHTNGLDQLIAFLKARPDPSEW